LDYLRAHEAHQSVLVVSPGNDERRELNQAIRKLLVDQGHGANDGHEHAILVRRDLTVAQQRYAGSYREGDVLYLKARAKGIARYSYAQVAAVDRERNALVFAR
jgi:hypothetical protein